MSCRNLLGVVILEDVVKTDLSEVQFRFEIWGEGWICGNVRDMAFCVVRFLVNCRFFGAIVCSARHCCHSFLLANGILWQNPNLHISPSIFRRATECQHSPNLTPDGLHTRRLHNGGKIMQSGVIGLQETPQSVCIRPGRLSLDWAVVLSLRRQKQDQIDTELYKMMWIGVQ